MVVNCCGAALFNDAHGELGVATTCDVPDALLAARSWKR